MGVLIGLGFAASDVAAQTNAQPIAAIAPAARAVAPEAHNERHPLAAQQRHPLSATQVFALAETYDKLGASSRALATYRQYLRQDADGRDAASARERVAALSATLASRGVQQITLSSSPPGATTFVDGEPIGAAPVTLDVPPGAHAVTMRASGHASASADVDMPAGRPLDVTLVLPADHVPHAAAQEHPAPTPLAAAKAPPALNAGRSETPYDPALRIGGFAALGAGVAALGGALGVEILRRDSTPASRQRDASRTTGDADPQRSQATLATVLASTGGALAAVGGVLLLVSYASPEKKPRSGLALACLPSKCQATFSGAF